MGIEKPLVIFSDLDGTLLEFETYSWHEAAEALGLLVRRRIPLVLCTSKTRSEVEEFRAAFRNCDPFIVENGGAVYVPVRDWNRAVPGGVRIGEYWQIPLGKPYDVLLSAVAEIRKQTGLGLRGFADLEARQVAELTGLSLERARRAKEREFDEPLIVHGNEEQDLLAAWARKLGLRVSRGGRFWHLHGGADKGRAVKRVVSLYDQELGSVTTVGIGDSANDLPMLEAVDVPVLVQKPDGTYDDRVDLDGLIRAPAPGPRGWNWSVKWLLDQPGSGPAHGRARKDD